MLIAILLAGASPGASGHSELFPRELQGESENALFPVDDPLDNLTSDSNSTLEDSDSSIASEEDLEPTVSSNSSNASRGKTWSSMSVWRMEKVDADPIGADEGFVHFQWRGWRSSTICNGFGQLLSRSLQPRLWFGPGTLGVFYPRIARRTKCAILFRKQSTDATISSPCSLATSYLSYLLTIPLYGLARKRIDRVIFLTFPHASSPWST